MAVETALRAGAAKDDGVGGRTGLNAGSGLGLEEPPALAVELLGVLGKVVVDASERALWRHRQASTPGLGKGETNLGAGIDRSPGRRSPGRTPRRPNPRSRPSSSGPRPCASSSLRARLRASQPPPTPPATSAPSPGTVAKSTRRGNCRSHSLRKLIMAGIPSPLSRSPPPSSLACLVRLALQVDRQRCLGEVD